MNRMEQTRQESIRIWAQAQRQALHEAVRNTPVAIQQISPAAAAGASASGGGSTSSPIIEVAYSQSIFYIHKNEESENWQLLAANYTTGEFNLTDLGVPKTYAYYYNEIMSNGSVLYIGANQQTGTVWFAFVDAAGNLTAMFKDVETSDNNWSSLSNEGMSIAFAYRPAGEDIYRYYWTCGEKFNTADVQIVSGGDNYPYNGWFSTSAALIDGSFTSYYYDADNVEHVYLFRPDGTVVELNINRPGEYVDYSFMSVHSDYMAVLFRSEDTTYITALRIIEADGTYTDLNWSNTVSYMYDMDVYGSDKIVMITKNDNTGEWITVFYDRSNGLVECDPVDASLYPSYDYYTLYRDSFRSWFNDAQSTETAIVTYSDYVGNSYGFTVYSNLTFNWKVGFNLPLSHTVNVDEGNFSLAWISWWDEQASQPRFLCHRGGSSNLESIFLADWSYKYDTHDVAWDSVYADVAYNTSWGGKDDMSVVTWTNNDTGFRTLEFWNKANMLHNQKELSTYFDSDCVYGWGSNPVYVDSNNKNVYLYLSQAAPGQQNVVLSYTDGYNGIVSSNYTWYDGGTYDQHTSGLSGEAVNETTGVYLVSVTDNGYNSIILVRPESTTAEIVQEPIQAYQYRYLTSQHLIYLTNEETTRKIWVYLLSDLSIAQAFEFPLDVNLNFFKVVNNRWIAHTVLISGEIVLYMCVLGQEIKSYTIPAPQTISIDINDWIYFD